MNVLIAIQQVAPKYWKAILAFVAPGAVVIGSAVLDSSAGGSSITTAEWVTAAVACVVTSTSVGVKSNAGAYNHDELGA